MSRRVRIVDIAETLGLSTATVSNVIHGKTNKISEETVALVQKALEEENYVPEVARILMGQNKSSIIGVVIFNAVKYEGHALEDPFISSALNSLSNLIEKEGLFMMVKLVDSFNVDQVPEFASMWNMEGMILIGFCKQDYHKLRSLIRVPFVIYDGYAEDTSRICNLIIDHYDGGFQVGLHFKEIGLNNAIIISDNNMFMDKERIEGFIEGFGNNTEILLIPMEKSLRKDFYKQKIDYIKNFKGIFSVSDYYAVDLMETLLKEGVKVPEDVSIIGFDDSPLCMQVRPNLSSVHQDQNLRAQIAMKTLRELKKGESEGRTITIPVNLILRDSSL